jgi:ankyrin repeat protein
MAVSNGEGRLPIRSASGLGPVEVVKLLWKYGANFNVHEKPDKRGLPPVHVASIATLWMQMVILERDANVDIQSENGDTLLGLAYYWGHFALAKFLLESGANIMIQDGRRTDTVPSSFREWPC